MGMGGGGGGNQFMQMMMMQNQQAAEMSRRNEQYGADLASQKKFFDSLMAGVNSTQGQDLSANVKPNGGYYGTSVLPQGTFLSSSGSRNSFLGGAAA